MFLYELVSIFILICPFLNFINQQSLELLYFSDKYVTLRLITNHCFSSYCCLKQFWVFVLDSWRQLGSLVLMVQFLNSNIKFVKDWEKNYKKSGICRPFQLFIIPCSWHVMFGIELADSRSNWRMHFKPQMTFFNDKGHVRLGILADRRISASVSN